MKVKKKEKMKVKNMKKKFFNAIESKNLTQKRQPHENHQVLRD